MTKKYKKKKQSEQLQDNFVVFSKIVTEPWPGEFVEEIVEIAEIAEDGMSL